MNWYKKTKKIKIASITFSIPEVERIPQPKNLMNIMFDFFDCMWYETNIAEILGLNHMDMSISSDSSYSDETGYFDVYITNAEKDFLIQKGVDIYNENRYGVVLKFMGIENNIAKILVAINETGNLPTIPFLNLSNDNARSLLDLLEDNGVFIDGDYNSGEIDAESLYYALNNIELENLHEYTQEKVEEDNYIDFGRTNQQVINYLKTLEEMVEYINNYDMPNAIIQYG